MWPSSSYNTIWNVIAHSHILAPSPASATTLLGVITTMTSSTANHVTCLNKTTANDCNIYIAILDVADNCPSATFQYWHVKGHQDKDPTQKLTIPEQHNVDSDKLAKAFVHDHMLHSTDMSNP